MRALFNGVEGGTLTQRKGTDGVYRLVLTTDAGGVQALSTGTVDVLVYDTADRRNAALKTISATVTTAANGFCTLTISAATLNIGPGIYYAFARFTLSGVITFGEKYAILVVE
jgi:hypothetical protein